MATYSDAALEMILTGRMLPVDPVCLGCEYAPGCDQCKACGKCLLYCCCDGRGIEP